MSHIKELICGNCEYIGEKKNETFCFKYDVWLNQYNIDNWERCFACRNKGIENGIGKDKI